MILTDIIEASFAHQRSHDVTITEIHVSPRIEREIRLSESVTAILPPLPSDVLGYAAGSKWFVDGDLTGEQYRFVTVPRLQSAEPLSHTESPNA